jgi:hypothetical protein
MLLKSRTEIKPRDTRKHHKRDKTTGSVELSGQRSSETSQTPYAAVAEIWIGLLMQTHLLCKLGTSFEWTSTYRLQTIMSMRISMVVPTVVAHAISIT